MYEIEVTYESTKLYEITKLIKLILIFYFVIGLQFYFCMSGLVQVHKVKIIIRDNNRRQKIYLGI